MRSCSSHLSNKNVFNNFPNESKLKDGSFILAGRSFQIVGPSIGSHTIFARVLLVIEYLVINSVFFYTGQVPNSKYQLLSVHVVIRHGDRSAIHSFPGSQHSKTIHCKVTPEIMHSLPFMDGYLETMLRNTEDGGRKPGQTYAGYDLYPNTEICPKGTLTPYGAAQQVRNGMLLRQKYLDHNLLKSENFEDDVDNPGNNLFENVSECSRLSVWIPSSAKRRKASFPGCR